jgi:hypothetical protein
MIDREHFARANEILRSFYAVALREGAETNWHGIQRTLQVMLVEQSQQLNGTTYLPAATATARTYRLAPDDEPAPPPPADKRVDEVTALRGLLAEAMGEGGPLMSKRLLARITRALMQCTTGR